MKDTVETLHYTTLHYTHCKCILYVLLLLVGEVAHDGIGVVPQAVGQQKHLIYIIE